MPVHVYGNPCDMDAIMKIADDHELFVIEDCCEALGAPVGDRGIMATYSFYFSHHITTLEGGMVVARNVYDADMLRTLRAHGWTREQVQRQHHEGIDDKFLFVNMGYNLRASEANAAMGIVQYPKLAGFVESRREAARMYQAVFTSEIFYEDCFSLQKDSGGSSWFGFPIIVNDIAPFTAKELRAYFEANGIETRPMICGNIARQPAMHLFPHRTVGNLHYADHIMQNAFSIGCHQNITEDDVAWVATVLERFLDNA